MGFLDNQRRKRHERSVDWDELVPLLLLDYELELATRLGGSQDDQVRRATMIRDQVLATVGEDRVRRAFIDADFELRDTGEDAVIMRALEVSGYSHARSDLVPESGASPAAPPLEPSPLADPIWPAREPVRQPSALDGLDEIWSAGSLGAVDEDEKVDAVEEVEAIEEIEDVEPFASVDPDDWTWMIPDGADRDGDAYAVAERAIRSWLDRFPAVAQLARESDGGATKRSRVLAEAYKAAAATRLAVREGDTADRIFDDQRLLANAQTEAGITKEWVVAFMQVRCIAIGYMLSLLGHKDMTAELGRMFREFFAADQ